MTALLSHRLSLLADGQNPPLLAAGLRGIEREALRIDPAGKLALTPHPRKLGAALTHALITTDYSESLLEFITPALREPAAVLSSLDAIHRFACTALDGEMLSSQSMPCHLPDEEAIPIAWYGDSHIGMLKHVYRRGLALRYGKAMQCISGIHYNFSVAGKLWEVLQADEKSAAPLQDYQSEAYVALIRNFQRYSWLLMYLFGASPALATGFLGGRAHRLETLSADTLYLPFATSLRMSDLGYQNNAQAGLVPPYNTLREYMSSLLRAVQLPYPAYEALGTQRDGEWVQINTNVLQIENEFYATIRPKRTIHTGERPIEALCARGVEYIEVRCMDVDPFEPLGIGMTSMRFLDAFLLFCALEESPPTTPAEGLENSANFARVVTEGRRPGLQLQRGGVAVGLKEWGIELLDRIGTVAAALDAQQGQGEHLAALAAQRAKLLDATLTPSARVLAAIEAHGGSLAAFALEQSRRHAADFRARPPTPEEAAYFAGLAQDSLAQQAKMEQEQTGDFDAFITDYRARTPAQLCA